MCMPPSRGPGRQPRSRRWGVRGGDPELVRTAVELANHQVEVAQLRQALASRVWIEQAKGMVAATEGITLDQAFHQLRGRARSSSRKLAEVAQELVQDVQRERVAAKAGLAQRTAALDHAQDDLAARERAADQRDHIADERDRAADDRNHLADARERAPMYATGSPTNPSSGRLEGAAGTNELGSVRRVSRRQVLLRSGATRKWGHRTRHLPPLPAAVGPPATPPGYRGWAAGLVRDPGGDRP